MVVDIPDVVTYTNFGDHRLRGFWVPVGQISHSHIDFHRRAYNTLALPCECVMGEGEINGKRRKIAKILHSNRKSRSANQTALSKFTPEVHK